MSSSKGRGAAAYAVAEGLRPEQLRLLMVRPSPTHPHEFDPIANEARPRVCAQSDGAPDANRPLRRGGAVPGWPGRWPARFRPVSAAGRGCRVATRL